MVDDDDFERGIQALLDGRPLSPSTEPGLIALSGDSPLQVIDAIARVNRTAVLGRDVSPDRPAALRWGDLELRGEIGRGASGVVHRAWDPKLAREVALKLLEPDADPGDALEEGRLLARLHHPHIVGVFGADTHDEIAGVWMELLEGETLDEILARDGVFGAEETLLIGLDLTQALSAVHSAGLLHRDVKARNVLRERGGRMVLMDLGAGRSVDKTPDWGDTTGTPMYMAPEVLGGSPASVRSDMYSLGVLLYRLLTGTFPVTATDLAALRSAHAAAHRVPLGDMRPDVAGEVATTIERACDPNAELRYVSAAEFEVALGRALGNLLSQRASVAPPLARAWMRWRKRVMVAAAAIAATMVSLWIGWDTVPGRGTRRTLGLTVPPRSTLYLSVNGALGIVRHGRYELVPYNPTTATVIAVSADQGIRTMAGLPPWTPGARFRLDGVRLAAPPVNNELCCFHDGTTDGRHNYAARRDSTLLAPIGSRPLAPAALYQFGLDWSDPEFLFPLTQDGTYLGVAYSSARNTFWLARVKAEGSYIEEWNRDGQHISTPINFPAATFGGLAHDPRDQTLWVVRQQQGSAIRLENFDLAGRHLGSFDVDRRDSILSPGGAEFEWTR